MTKQNNIHTAILGVMSEVGYVQKTGKMDFGSTKYKYAGEADLIAALRPHLVSNGITFRASKVTPLNIEDVEIVKWDNYNKKEVSTLYHRFLAEYIYTFTHADSDTSIKVPAVGDGLDTGDKAAYKAATGALKYALRQTFIIETGDDPDNTASDSQSGSKINIDEDVREDAGRQEYEKIHAELIEHQAKTLEELKDYWNSVQSRIKRVAKSQQQELLTIKDNVKAFIEGRGIDDEIKY